MEDALMAIYFPKIATQPDSETSPDSINMQVCGNRGNPKRRQKQVCKRERILSLTWEETNAAFKMMLFPQTREQKVCFSDGLFREIKLLD